MPMVTNFGLGFLNRVMQQNLNGISPSSEDVTVIIDGQPL